MHRGVECQCRRNSSPPNLQRTSMTLWLLMSIARTCGYICSTTDCNCAGEPADAELPNSSKLHHTRTRTTNPAFPA